MRIESILNELQAQDLLQAVQPHWQESLTSCPDGVPDFLRPAEISSNLQWCGLIQSRMNQQSGWLIAFQ
jgi:hypothetical protein